MVVKQNRSNGSPVWGCETYPYCRGTKPYEVGLAEDEWASTRKS